MPEWADQQFLGIALNLWAAAALTTGGVMGFLYLSVNVWI